MRLALPVGLNHGFGNSNRKALKIRHRLIPDKLNMALHQSRYVILLFFLLLPIVLYVLDPQQIMVSPSDGSTISRSFRPYSIMLDPMIPLIVPWTGQLNIGTCQLKLSLRSRNHYLCRNKHWLSSCNSFCRCNSCRRIFYPSCLVPFLPHRSIFRRL